MLNYFSYLTGDGEEELQIIISDVKTLESADVSSESPMFTEQFTGSKNKANFKTKLVTKEEREVELDENSGKKREFMGSERMDMKNEPMVIEEILVDIKEELIDIKEEPMDMAEHQLNKEPVDMKEKSKLCKNSEEV